MHTPFDMVTGFIHKTKFGDIKILEYINSESVRAEFVDTGFVIKRSSSAIRLGQIKDKMAPSVCGVGFLGCGKYTVTSGGKVTPWYVKWHSMLSRCYLYSQFSKRKGYEDCSVCEEWHNFQNFSKWMRENYPNDGSDYELDKDIKVKGNKIYSPDTCLFVSKFENLSEAITRTLSKGWEFLDPNGRVVKFNNLNEFCRLNDLDKGNMAKVYHGERKSHKKWRSNK